MGLFKRKEVPMELPSLAVDEVKPVVSSLPAIVSSVPEAKEQIAYKPLPVAVSSEQVSAAEEVKKALIEDKDETGYFKSLVKSITEETDDLDKLSSWYKNKFMPGDMVFQMREYWQKQQPELMLKNVSGELKQKLTSKTDKLHALEKDWQEIYFNLLSKEEEIRKEEKELKQSLAEFIDTLKRTIGENK
jgi:hypothetical protein